MAYIPDALRRLVVERASQRCEYCLLPDGLSFYPHEVDHVIALKHQGQTTAENLAYACWRCN
jgi:5-methylcytosine-specific restriction endonuclease McrA